MDIDRAELDKFKLHCLSVYPNEAVGVLIAGKFHPTKNVSSQPTEHFETDPTEHLRLEIKHGQIEALLHSHPYQIKSIRKWPPVWPSGNDMQQWLKGLLPWGIVSTEGQTVSDPVWLDENYIAPLIGRQFIHGIHDCYSCVRDWFRLERNITIPNYPRGMEWWEKGYNLYEENFKAAGFSSIKEDDATVGDCLMIAVRSKIIHHAAVITGPNEILHHGIRSLSGRDRLDRWAQHASYVRYTGNK